MPWIVTLANLGVGLGVGLLVGLERQRASAERHADWNSGIRTFALMGLLGGLLGVLAEPLGPWFVGLGLAIVGVLLFFPVLLEIRAGRRRGATTELSCMAVVLMGIAAGAPLPELEPAERWRLVAAAGVATMAILNLRRPLHELAANISSEDLFAAAKLLVLLIIVLPLLPDVGVGPGGRINPFGTGVMVALIAAIGFAGYIAVRIFGASKGMLLTGALGGLVSSTAVTLNFSGRVRESAGLAPLAAAGIALASSIMLPRLLLLVLVSQPTLLPSVIVPVGGMALSCVAGAAILVWRQGGPGDSEAAVALRNPFSLGEAVRFGLVYMVILVVAGLAREHYGDRGLYLAAALAGLTDVDAITLSACELYGQGLPASSAVTTILVAIGSNTLVKGGIATGLGGWRLGWRVLAFYGPMLVVGALLQLAGSME